MGQKISCRIEENEAYVRKRLENCDDFIIRPMLLGEEKKIRCLDQDCLCIFTVMPYGWHEINKIRYVFV